MSNKTSGFKRAIGIVLGVITMLVLIALFVVLVMAPIPNIWVDKVAASDNAIDQTVSPTQSETYCPAPIGLADTGTYGDSAFQATVGNLSTQARYAAFGSVYSATVSAIGQKSSSDDVTLKDADSTDDSSVKTGAQKINQGARLINTRMLQAAAGTGTVGTIASWADDGDVRGISAASCVSTSLSQSFLLSDSTTGTTQQLIVSNLSTKPTTVDIAVWGSGDSRENGIVHPIHAVCASRGGVLDGTVRRGRWAAWSVRDRFQQGDSYRVRGAHGDHGWSDTEGF